MSPTKLPDNLPGLIKEYTGKAMDNALSTNTDVAAAEAAASKLFKHRRIKWLDYPFAEKITRTDTDIAIPNLLEKLTAITRQVDDRERVIRSFRSIALRPQLSFQYNLLARFVIRPLLANYCPAQPGENYDAFKVVQRKRQEMLDAYHQQKITSSFDIHWGYYDFFFSIIKDKTLDQVKPYIALYKSCGGSYLSGDNIILYPKPTQIHVDQEGAPHSPDSPALDFDGHYTVYALHGVILDEKTIMRPNDITPQEIIDERNTTIANIKMERLTIPNFMAKVCPTILDEDYDSQGNSRKLLHVKFGNDMTDGRIVCVEVICPSTDKQYLLRVPPTMETCAEAIAWTFGMDKKDYAPIIEK